MILNLQAREAEVHVEPLPAESRYAQETRWGAKELLPLPTAGEPVKVAVGELLAAQG